MSLASQKTSASSGTGKISNTFLLEALDDKDTFYNLYISHINDAIARYTKAERKRSGVKLYGYLAALDL
jgi:trafficking protein particle complex subunit 10